MDDFKLTEHFSFFELTATVNPTVQKENRTLNNVQMEKLAKVADLLEAVRLIVNLPISVHSGYRCKKLNDLVGSTDKSQHLLCEAADFSVTGMPNTEAFAKIQQAALNGRLQFGQLIHERAKRSYGVSDWLHISLGAPYREKNGQVLTMRNGLYELVRTISKTSVS